MLAQLQPTQARRYLKLTMKTKSLFMALCLGGVLQAMPAMAQLPAPAAPKPPVGVPTDAKLFNGKWYKVFFEKTTWDNAKAKCTALGGQLVVIPDEVTWVFVKTLSPAILWLGATDEKIEGVWVWVDGTPMTFAPWRPNQPDNTKGSENYLSVKEGRWNDLAKSDKSPVGYICEWRAK